MMNRCLSLIVSVAAPISAAVMLFTGAHPVGAVTLSERMPCIGLALLALALAIVHARVAAGRAARIDLAMWSGLTVFFLVASFASPHLGAWGIVAALTLAASSIARLVAAHGRPAVQMQSPFRRRIFA